MIVRSVARTLVDGQVLLTKMKPVFLWEGGVRSLIWNGLV
jgi:hypothetical protein